MALTASPTASISNRRSRSSRNAWTSSLRADREHIESEIALKPEPPWLNTCSALRAYRIGDRAQAGTIRFSLRNRGVSISNRRSRSSRNEKRVYLLSHTEHIESEIALKPERNEFLHLCAHRAYRIGDRAQAGTQTAPAGFTLSSISNRRSRSSRNRARGWPERAPEHIESEIALKPEHGDREVHRLRRAYRIGDRAQAGTIHYS